MATGEADVGASVGLAATVVGSGAGVVATADVTGTTVWNPGCPKKTKVPGGLFTTAGPGAWTKT